MRDMFFYAHLSLQKQHQKLLRKNTQRAVRPAAVSAGERRSHQGSAGEGCVICVCVCGWVGE